MGCAGKKKELERNEKETSRDKTNNKRQDKTEKRPWSHIIDRDKYCDGPGDNIYVFG